MTETTITLPSNACRAARVAVSTCSGDEYVHCSRWRCGISRAGLACALCREGKFRGPMERGRRTTLARSRAPDDGRQTADDGASTRPPPCRSCRDKRAQTVQTMREMAGLTKESEAIVDRHFGGEGTVERIAQPGADDLHRQQAGETPALLSPVPHRNDVRALPAGTHTPRLAVVVPCRNEVTTDRQGRYLLRETFGSLVATSADYDAPDLWLIDDASDKPLPALSGKGEAPPPVRVVRNPAQLGVDGSRNLGAKLAFEAGAEVVGILDGHMRVETHNTRQPILGGVQRLAQLAVETQGIVVARCGHIEIDIPHDHYPLCGGEFVPITHPRQSLGMAWKHINPPRGVHRINGLLGASYFFPRKVWERLAGFIACCKVWGFSEEGVALKAAFLDIPIHVDCDVTLTHWFRPTGPHPYVVDGYQKWCNRARVLAVTFDPDTFERFWLPRLRTADWNDRYLEDLRAPDVIAEGEEFRRRKVRTDAEVLRSLFGVEWK